VTTGQIYWGAVPFVAIQIVMVGLLIAYPQLVTATLDRGAKVDPGKVRIRIDAPAGGGGEEPPPIIFK
jgi:hypothetical protein